MNFGNIPEFSRILEARDAILKYIQLPEFAKRAARFLEIRELRTPGFRETRDAPPEFGNLPEFQNLAARTLDSCRFLIS